MKSVFDGARTMSSCYNGCTNVFAFREIFGDILIELNRFCSFLGNNVGSRKIPTTTASLELVEGEFSVSHCVV